MRAVKIFFNQKVNYTLRLIVITACFIYLNKRNQLIINVLNISHFRITGRYFI